MRTHIEALQPSAHTSRTIYERLDTVFVQGERGGSVLFIESGRVRLVTTSPQGRAAVVGVLGAGDYFGEGALAGQTRRRSTAVAMTRSRITAIGLAAMRRGLRSETALADSFRRHLLERNVRIEAAIVVQLNNSTERRLARTLLLLAAVEEHDTAAHYDLPLVSRTLLAEVIGSTRARVDLLMNGFRKRGFLERRARRDGGLRVHRSLISVLIED
jgi:CRP/FNR family transcriptional regulator, cyclic AMP receptor protein